MALILFTQCDREFEMSASCLRGYMMPIEHRQDYYERILLTEPNFATIDEWLILIAMRLRKEGKLESLTLRDYCRCDGECHKLDIVVGDDGCMAHKPWHPFFNRMPQLR